MLVRFADAVVEKHPALYEPIAQRYWRTTIRYIIDSKFRIAVKLSPWVKAFVDQPSAPLQAFAQSIPTKKHPDEQMLAILQAVKRKIRYVGDQANWHMDEKWQTPEETLQSASGDCEDGAILIYVTGRLKGIPADQLYIMSGFVQGGGHCWCAYRPKNYPLNWAFLDWCYWPNLTSIAERNLYFIAGNNIIGYARKDDEITGTDGNYQTLWNAFNERGGHYRFDFNHSGLPQ